MTDLEKPDFDFGDDLGDQFGNQFGDEFEDEFGDDLGDHLGESSEHRGGEGLGEDFEFPDLELESEDEPVSQRSDDESPGDPSPADRKPSHLSGQVKRNGKGAQPKDPYGPAPGELEEGEFENPEEDGLPEMELESEWFFVEESAPRQGLVRQASQTAFKRGSQGSAASIFRKQAGGLFATARHSPANEDPKVRPAPIEVYLPEAIAEWVNPGFCSAEMLEGGVLLQAMALAAIQAGSEDEAAGFAAAMVPVALRLAPGVYRGLWPGIPALMAGIEGVARLFYRQAPQRPLIGLIPAMLVGTIARLARQVTRGKSITGQAAAALLARQVAETLARGEAGRRAVTYTRQKPPPRKGDARPDSGLE